MIDRLLAGLADSACPSLDAILRGMFVLYGEARLRVLEKQEGGGAREQIVRHGGNGFLRAFPQIRGDEALKRAGAEHQRTESRRIG